MPCRVSRQLKNSNVLGYFFTVLDGRRRELLGENFIYHDMVRTGRAVERLGIQKFQLLLPIPGKELQLNPLLEPNPGY